LVRVIGQGVAMGWAGLGKGQGAPECRGGWEGGERGLEGRLDLDICPGAPDLRHWSLCSLSEE